jgi:hypothetical protein
MDEKKLKKLYEKNLKILNELVKQKGNKYCADCCEKGPKWGSPAVGIFLCIKCAGFHRKMGSIVKSIALDNWSQEETETMIDNGNDKVNSIFLNGSNKPLEADYDYIKDKYERRIFCQKSSQQKSDLKESLLILENMGFARKSLNLRALDLSDGNVQEALELLLSGALGEASASGKGSKGKSRAESEEPQVERSEVNLPKLSAKKNSPQEEVGTSMDTLKMPELRKERVYDSREDISKDERIKQALENAMRQLASFGFTDISDTKVALRQAKGDVEKALSILVKWKDERVLREYKQQKQQDDTKKNSQPNNLLGSMDNISQSGYFHHQPTHLQPLAYNQAPLDLANQSQQIPRFDQQVSQSYQNDQTMPLAQNTLANQPQQMPRFDQQVSQSYQNNQTMPLAQNTLANQPQQIQKSHQFDVSQTLQPTQQSLQAAPQAQQHPIDLFSSDQFNHAPALQAPPIQPSVKVFDLLGGSSSSSSYNNPFAAKPLLPIVNGQKNDNQTASVIKSSNSKQHTFVPNDLVGLSFNAAGSATTYPAKSLNDQNIQQAVVAQNITGVQGILIIRFSNHREVIQRYDYEFIQCYGNEPITNHCTDR